MSVYRRYGEHHGRQAMLDLAEADSFLDYMETRLKGKKYEEYLEGFLDKYLQVKDGLSL